MKTCLMIMNFMAAAACFSADFAQRHLLKEIDRYEYELYDLRVSYLNISNDLARYEDAFNDIYVPNEIVVTNVNYLRNGGKICVSKTIRLSSYKKKIERVKLVLKNRSMEAIYCRWFPKENFDRIHDEIYERFEELTRDYNEHNSTKAKRRNEYSAKIDLEKKRMDDEFKGTLNRYNDDLRSVAALKKWFSEPNAGGKMEFESRYRPMLNKICRRYYVSEIASKDVNEVKSKCDEVDRVIRGRLQSFMENRYHAKNTEISTLVRKEAQADNDDVMAESFKQDKMMVLEEYYDKIVNRPIEKMNEKKMEIEENIAECVAKLKNMRALLAIWSDLPEEQKAEMNKDVLRKTLDSVWGEGFYDGVEQKKKDEAAERLNERERDLRLKEAEQKIRFNEDDHKLRSRTKEIYNKALENQWKINRR